MTLKVGTLGALLCGCVSSCDRRPFKLSLKSC